AGYEAFEQRHGLLVIALLYQQLCHLPLGERVGGVVGPLLWVLDAAGSQRRDLFLPPATGASQLIHRGQRLLAAALRFSAARTFGIGEAGDGPTEAPPHG